MMIPSQVLQLFLKRHAEERRKSAWGTNTISLSYRASNVYVVLQLYKFAILLNYRWNNLKIQLGASRVFKKT